MKAPKTPAPKTPAPAPRAPYPARNLGSHLKAPASGEIVTEHHRKRPKA